MKKQAQVAEKTGEGEGGGRREKYEAKNWKELTERQFNKLTPVERSRYMAVSPFCCYDLSTQHTPPATQCTC